MISLTPEQRAVVDESCTTVAVACPGSGKTTTIVEKAAAWIEEGIHPKTIALITFTRKAAAEIYKRLRARSGPKADDVYVGTFHSLCFSVIAENWEKMGYSGRDLMVLDREDTKRLLKEALEASKEKRITIALSDLQDYGSGNGPETPIIRIYRELLQRENVCDYSLLARMVTELAQREPMVYAWLKTRCNHLIVDEFQDCDAAQSNFYMWAANRFCFVGDVDQTIYKWRGADDRALQRVIEHRGPAVYNLTINHRSGSEIIGAADAFRFRTPCPVERQEMRPREGAPTGTLRILDEYGVDIEQNLIAGVQRGTVAVIARTNYLLAEWSRRLQNAGISHHVVGRDDKILEQDAVKLAVAYLAWPELRDVGILAERVLAAEGVTALQRAEIKAWGRERDLTQFDAMVTFDAKVTPLRGDLVAFYDGYMEQDLGQRVSEACVRARQRRGGIDPDVFAAFRAMLTQYMELTPAKYQSGAGFVNWIASRDPHDDIRDHRLQLMTAHAAKGLEFDSVFIVGLGETEFPYRGDAADDMTEERRLFYVAMTRARESLYLVRPSGKVPSRFLEEIVHA